MTTLSWDINPAVLLLFAVQIVTVVVFIVRIHNRAEAADETAKKAQDEIDRAQLSISALSASLSLHREQVAANYVDRDALRDIKRELIDAINKMGDRIDQTIKMNGYK